MQCAHCSTPIPDDARFCHSCGSQVSDAEGQARASASMDLSSFQHMEKLLKEDTEGEFEIQGMLGRGGMAVVFLATETKLGRKVAIKVLPPELTFGHGVDRFMREAKTAALLDHPHIIPIYRIGSGSKLFWYAMKFLEGRSLDDLMKEKGKLPVDDVIPILEQVADALDYAHVHNVIHRDMKPANVMLDSRNRVIVTDFGIAKALTEQTLTASGSVVGTPYYMSPEQGMGTGVSGRSDQYSVAVMAYRMLSGQFPFEGDSAIDILHKHCMIPPSPLEFIQPGLPKHVYLAVHKALEKKPERRFSTVAALVEALKAPTPELEISGEVSTDGATIAVPAASIRPGRPGGTGTTPPTPVPAVSSARTVVQTPPTPTPRPSA
ncbi:MAG: protein kinase, partial [Gemmatimonadetes bacterium]|nr:protein kinase [Gemmatimonadota bacterium]